MFELNPIKLEANKVDHIIQITNNNIITAADFCLFSKNPFLSLDIINVIKIKKITNKIVP